ncbi:hypothetical protein ACFL2P_01385 [Candidatus Moduliflexota bacterium]
MDNIEESAVRCLKMLLDGRVSWDHVIEEFGTREGVELEEVVKLMEEASRNRDRYAKAKEIEPELKRRIEDLIGRLEGKPG